MQSANLKMQSLGIAPAGAIIYYPKFALQILDTLILNFDF